MRSGREILAFIVWSLEFSRGKTFGGTHESHHKPVFQVEVIVCMLGILSGKILKLCLVLGKVFEEEKK